ncbi:hypothetical protein WMY93_027673 [Mugilogobius chulae]|uniref:G0/G1 switch protein 2 n=1 Tax=Mugilogobius chulae TaxID=88201 RepID=A0AAW0MXX5_9GOBI
MAESEKKLIQMEQKEELLPFLMELLQQKPTRQTLKIYAIGSTLAVLGAIAGLIQSVFPSDEPEDAPAVDVSETDTQQAEEVTAPRTQTVIQTPNLDETKDETLWTEHRRSSANRLHAS